MKGALFEFIAGLSENVQEIRVDKTKVAIYPQKMAIFMFRLGQYNKEDGR